MAYRSQERFDAMGKLLKRLDDILRAASVVV